MFYVRIDSLRIEINQNWHINYLANAFVSLRTFLHKDLTCYLICIISIGLRERRTTTNIHTTNTRACKRFHICIKRSLTTIISWCCGDESALRNHGNSSLTLARSYGISAKILPHHLLCANANHLPHAYGVCGVYCV